MRLTHPLVVALVICAESACQNAASSVRAAPHNPQEPRVPQSASLASSSPVVAPDNTAQLRLHAQVEALLTRVNEVRGLPVRGHICSRVLDRPSLLRQLQQLVQTQLPPSVVQGEGDFLRTMGFLPIDYDFESGVYELLQSQVAGYYDPDRKCLYVLDDLAKNEVEVTLLHELVHVLQDQNFDLGPRLRFRPGAGDLLSATHGLAEGDATSAMLDSVLAPSQRSAPAIPDAILRLEVTASVAMSPALARVPSVLRNSLVAPYVDGTIFVHQIRRRGGWAAVDSVWLHPPETSEQLLHLDKFVAREPPEVVDIPSLRTLGPEWDVTYSEVYGEQGLRVALEEWMPRRAAAEAAAGWAGDRCALARHRDDPKRALAAAWRVRFDRAAQDAEASQAHEAVSLAWQRTASQWRPPCAVLGQEHVLAVARSARDVAIVAISPAGAKRLRRPPCAVASAWAAEVATQK